MWRGPNHLLVECSCDGADAQPSLPLPAKGLPHTLILRTHTEAWSSEGVRMQRLAQAVSMLPIDQQSPHRCGWSARAPYTPSAPDRPQA